MTKSKQITISQKQAELIAKALWYYSARIQADPLASGSDKGLDRPMACLADTIDDELRPVF